MAKSDNPSKEKSTLPSEIGDFKLLKGKALKEALDSVTHVYHGGAVCETDSLGHATPDDRSPQELVVDSSQGFIPLWDRGVTLRWRFQEQSLILFQDPDALKKYVRELLGEALLAWDVAVPVKFTEAQEPWDFELVVRTRDNCTIRGCTLASAFFPGAGQNELVLFPRLFSQSRAEQIETMAHELGHVFGLRHFFAKVDETQFPAEIYGTHSRFSIMNYGANSRLTPTDIADLTNLYAEVWSSKRVEINGTPIRLMKPYSHFRLPGSADLVTLAPAAAAALRVERYPIG